MSEVSLELEVSEEEQVELEVEESGSASGIKDYNDLLNKPTLNGKVIEGAITEEDPTVPAWAKNATKPSYTPAEIGAVDGKNSITLQEIDEMFTQIFGK